MAANARQLKRRINSAKNIAQITKAMEMVAASKMKKAQAQALASRAYARALQASLSKIAANTPETLHPLLRHSTTGKTALVIIATDKGLCGPLNSTIFRFVTQWHQQAENPTYIPVGRKAVAFCQRLGLPIFAQFTDLPDHLSAGETLPLSTLLQDNFLSASISRAEFVYMDFVNTLSQKLRAIQLLPIALDTLADITDLPQQVQLTKEYTFEPSPKQILDQLLPYYIENTIYQILLESKASEHSARMVTMKNASQNAKDLMGDLKLSYNRSRQAAITAEIQEIATAAMTLS